MSATNVVRDTTAADYLNQTRMQQQSDLVGNTSQTNFILLYIIPQNDTINITDTVTNNANTQSLADTIDITDAVTQPTSIGTGTYQVCANLPLWMLFDGDVLDSGGNVRNGIITYNANLKALYKFEGNVNDSTSGGNNGTITGSANYVSGQEGAAFSFDGNSYINVPDAAALDPTGAITMTGWAYLPASVSGDTEKAILRKDGQYMVRIDAFSEAANRFSFFVWVNVGGVQTIRDRLSYIYTPNTWFHFVATYANNGDWKLYINGVLQVSSPQTANNLWTTTTVLGIGNLGNGTSLLKSGSRLDEIRIYNVELTAAQVSALYMVGKYGQSHTFDNGEYITFGSSSTVNYERTNTWSISCWIKTTDSGVTTIVAKGGFAAGWYVLVDTGGKPSLLLRDPVSNDLRVSTSLAYNDGTYHHLVITYDGSVTPAGIKIYIDGSSVSTTTITNTLTTGSILNSVIPTIGSGNSSLLYTGQLDDLRIYTRVLSAADITNIFINRQPNPDLTETIPAIVGFCDVAA